MYSIKLSNLEIVTALINGLIEVGELIFWKYNFFSQKYSFWVVEYSFGIFKVGMSVYVGIEVVLGVGQSWQIKFDLNASYQTL